MANIITDLVYKKLDPRIESIRLNSESRPTDTTFAFVETAVEPEKKWRETVRLFMANRPALIGFIVVVVFVFVGLFGPMLYPADPFEPVAFPLTGPGTHTLLGTDYLGRDVGVAILYGTRPTLLIAGTATLVTVFIGITLGAIAGYFGGIIDNTLMRITEFFQVLPPLVFAMVIVAVFSSDMLVVVLAIAVTTWTTEARLTRAEFLKIRERNMSLLPCNGCGESVSSLR